MCITWGNADHLCLHDRGVWILHMYHMWNSYVSFLCILDVSIQTRAIRFVFTITIFPEGILEVQTPFRKVCGGTFCGLCNCMDILLFVCICMHVMTVCIYVWVRAWLSVNGFGLEFQHFFCVWINVLRWACVCASLWLCMCVCIYVCMCANGLVASTQHHSLDCMQYRTSSFSVY